MNKVILTLDQHKIDPSVPADDRENYYERRAARAVLRDRNGKVALMYASKRQYYKLPGGGIDDGEEVIEALSRELMEETGCIAKIAQNLGITEEWRDFDKMHQISYAFAAEVISQDTPPAFTQSEIEEGFELYWTTNIDSAIGLVESNNNNEDVRVSFMSQRDTAILAKAKSAIKDF